ncbi:hypothetical protein LCGC14_1096390 [marine sediment metagenome]|uniref:Uncharacterized protein n=1 Tax=marine sediment metagenome TaxID=412755 RepID=A0A0F9MYK4_9ZZZZ
MKEAVFSPKLISKAMLNKLNDFLTDEKLFSLPPLPPLTWQQRLLVLLSEGLHRLKRAYRALKADSWEDV